MPITGPASYLPTMVLFLDHWADVNAALGAPNPLKVGQPNPAGGPPVLKTFADLEELKDELTTARDEVTTATVDLSVDRNLVRDAMAPLLARFNQFAAAVRSRYEGKAYERSLPYAPSVGDAPDTFARTIKKAETLWIKINVTLGATPLQLGAGTVADPFYPVASFSADLATLRSLIETATAGEQTLKTLIETRNDLQEEIAPLLRDYRQAVVSRFGAEHALVASLPRYSPPPGNKPDKPELTSALWNAAESHAEIAFTPSTSSDVVRHELRICAGPEYDEDLEVIAGSLAAGEPPLFTTASLLGAPGAVITARVVAITGDDRENESTAMSVQRPPP